MEKVQLILKVDSIAVVEIEASTLEEAVANLSDRKDLYSHPLRISFLGGSVFENSDGSDRKLTSEECKTLTDLFEDKNHICSEHAEAIQQLLVAQNAGDII